MDQMTPKVRVEIEVAVFNETEQTSKRFWGTLSDKMVRDEFYFDQVIDKVKSRIKELI